MHVFSLEEVHWVTLGVTHLGLVQIVFVALEACVQARNEGRDLAREGGDIIRAAAKWSPELTAACEV